MNYVENGTEDLQIEGQMNIYDYLDMKTPSPNIAVSKVFARCIKQMNLAEWKTFVYALTQIRWKEKNKNRVHLDKWQLIKILGLKANDTDISSHLKRAIGDLWKHSEVKFDDQDRDYWENGTFIHIIRCYKDYVLIVFTEDYMPLFEELDKDPNYYITMWAEDLFKMTSERSIIFYEYLRLHCDTRKTNTRLISTRDFKEMFNIPKSGKGSYMKPNGEFNRSEFEKKVILAVCDDLRHSQMINIHLNEDGLPYRKVKYHGRVRGYEFSWDVCDRPAVASAEEVAEIRKLDPKELKIAKDIATGKKKKPISNAKKAFGNYEHSDVDYDALLEQKQRGEN